MIAAKTVGWPSPKRRPAFSLGRGRVAATPLAGLAIAAGLLAIAPIASLVVFALGDSGDLWSHLARHVLPVALVQTALLLAGVSAVTLGIGIGSAWAVTTFDFPGRRALTWL